MKLSVAANYDPGLAPELAGLAVTEVYGKFPADLVGGGDGQLYGHPADEAELTAYVAALDTTASPSTICSTARALASRVGRSWQKRFMRLLDRLGAMASAD